MNDQRKTTTILVDLTSRYRRYGARMSACGVVCELGVFVAH